MRRPNGLARALLVAAPAAAALGGAVMAYARFVEPKWLDVTHVELTLPRLAPAFDGYRIAQFSDLHMEKWRDWDTLGRVIAQSNAFVPDVVAITGDFVHIEVADIGKRMADCLGQLRARDAVLGILGNHDYWGSASGVRQMLAAAGVTNISNDVYTIRRGDDALHIAGIDSYMQMRARFDTVMNAVPDDGHAAILLAHEPDFAYLSVPTKRFDLQLSGHSHGGQIRVPGIMQLVLPPFSRRFIAGLKRVKGMYLYTNRGLGMSGVNMRFNCRPELTLFTLRAGKDV